MERARHAERPSGPEPRRPGRRAGLEADDVTHVLQDPLTSKTGIGFVIDVERTFGSEL
jgi:hypothetical protein